MWDSFNLKVWEVFEVSNVVGNTVTDSLAIGDAGTGEWWTDACSNITNASVSTPSATYDPFDGLVHIVYNDYSSGFVRHETWDPNNHSWGCLNNQVGPFVDWSFPRSAAVGGMTC